MISRDHFRRFALPSLERNGVPGPRGLPYGRTGANPPPRRLAGHAALHTIQWVPGAGEAAAPAWVEMLQKIQKAGKGVQVLVTADELKVLYRQLAPRRRSTGCWTAPARRKPALLQWMKAHT